MAVSRMHRNTVAATSYRRGVTWRATARKLVGRWEKRGRKAGKTFPRRRRTTYPRPRSRGSQLLLLSALFFQVPRSGKIKQKFPFVTKAEKSQAWLGAAVRPRPTGIQFPFGRVDRVPGNRQKSSRVTSTRTIMYGPYIILNFFGNFRYAIAKVLPVHGERKKTLPI